MTFEEAVSLVDRIKDQVVGAPVVSTHCMAVPFSFLSRGYRESLHQKNYYSLLLLIGNSDI